VRVLSRLTSKKARARPRRATAGGVRSRAVGFYDDQILPRVIGWTCGSHRFDKVRRRSLEGLYGTVLELGLGTAPNAHLYPDTVTKVYAVEPSETARKLAAKQLARANVPVEIIGTDGQHVPLPDDSVDCVLSTWTLCTIPDVAQALSECHRVLHPDGRLVFLEHGLSTEPRVARRQQQFNGVQRRIAGGCNLDRKIDDIVRDAGFDLDHLARFTIAGPKVLSAMYAGTARPVPDRAGAPAADASAG
jgi:ubiquinone/menaquinone biosynthesis C-methylase UbiE